ncbi:MAG: hypothetical protein DRI48_04685 [Chloroflexi bacterium]|nr:MAG: hypothetical protein DRI48_04685 [Chloroflexota bacterium]
MRILITGGAGFIGSHLCDRLLADGHEVIAMDNLSTGSVDNIAHLAGNEYFQFIKHDVTNYIFIEGHLDAVLHLASLPSPVDYLNYPIQTLKVGALGTHKTLGLALAKGARFLLASTSEVYGDPLEHPQREDYWGNVNPIGPRGVYDESKRFAEALTMAYHRYHGVDTRIARIFNSVLANEILVFFNDSDFHLLTAEEYARQVESEPIIKPRGVDVPCFDPQTHRIVLKRASAFIKHPAHNKDAFLITTRYGRSLRVTGDHSVFRRGPNGLPEAIPVRHLTEDDYVALPAFLPMIEKDVSEVNLGEILIRQATCDEDLWEFALVSQQLGDYLVERKDEIYEILMASPRFDGSQNKWNTVGCQFRKYRKKGVLPLYVIARLQVVHGFEWPADGRLRPYTGGKSNLVPNVVEISDDLLWLLGLYLAEGTDYSGQGTYTLSMRSDERFLDRASRIFEEYGIRAGKVGPSSGRGPGIYAHSKVLYTLFEKVFQVPGHSRELRIPPWIMQLPLSRLKFFLEGYRQGDGTHTNYPQQRELAFNTSSPGLAQDLLYLLLRFGIVGSLGEYETTFTERYGDEKLRFWRVTVCEVSDFNILNWDEGVEQTLNAARLGDLVWAKIRSIEQIEVTDYVYDFSVPGAENFIAGSGVLAHNTYGPRMRMDDGRVVPNFICQALRGDPLTVYDEGARTRSFCYVSDLIEGMVRLLHSAETGPVNIGNPTEMTILDFAHRVLKVTGSDSPIKFVTPTDARTKDDPKVRCPDIGKAKRVLGWEPGVLLDEGLRYTAEYFRERVK